MPGGHNDRSWADIGLGESVLAALVDDRRRVVAAGCSDSTRVRQTQAALARDILLTSYCTHQPRSSVRLTMPASAQSPCSTYFSPPRSCS